MAPEAAGSSPVIHPNHPPAISSPPRWRVTAFDVFFLINVVLFVLMCVFTYYARFVRYRGAANVWEFFIYASGIILILAGLWRAFRDAQFSVGLLALVQAGILAHFAGAFIQIDGRRLYDCYLAGIRYDKYVHFGNAFVAVRVVRQTLQARIPRLDGLTRLVIGLSVLGLGAIVEIVEYLVVKTVPGNGVGGYDNNMQDLAANLCGAALSVLVLRSTAAPRLRLTTTSNPLRWGREQTLSLIELTLLTLAVVLVLWWVPTFVAPAPFAVLAALLIIGGLFFTAWISPVWIHGDTLHERGLGERRHAFIRFDNLRRAASQFGVLAMGGTIAILLMAEVWNPGWLARANWKAWTIRLMFYGVSAYLQALVYVGYVLVRLKSLIRHRVWLAVVAATLFGALHAPSLLVVGLTIGFGFTAAWIAWASPNVLAAAACQALLGLLLHRTLDLSLRVGFFYAHPDLHVFRQVIPFVGQLIGNLY